MRSLAAVTPPESPDVPFWFSSLKLTPATEPPPSIIDGFIGKTPLLTGVSRLDVKPMDPGRWIQIDTDYTSSIDWKKKVYAESPDTTCMCENNGAPGALELYSSIVAYLLTVHAHKFRRDGDRLLVVETGEFFDLGASCEVEALGKIGRLIAEDCLILNTSAIGQSPRVVGGFVASVFNGVAEVMGKSVTELHSSVRGMEDSVNKQIDKLLLHLKPARPIERINFQIFTFDHFEELKHQRRSSGLRGWPRGILNRVVVTNERQTMVRLPQSGDVVFMDHMQRTLLRDVRPEHARKCIEVMKYFPEGYHQERSGLEDSKFTEVLTYLREVSESRFKSADSDS